VKYKSGHKGLNPGRYQNGVMGMRLRQLGNGTITPVACVLSGWLSTNGLGARSIQEWPNDPHHWRCRANEVRALANQVGYLPAKDQLLRVAEEYDYLAKKADERAKGGWS
jgi:hypothetical protein